MNTAIFRPKCASTLVAIFFSGIFAGASAQNPADNALSQFMAGNFAQTKTLTADIISRDKNNALAYALHGRILVVDNDLDNGLADYEKAIKLAPDNGVYYAFEGACYQYMHKDPLSEKTFDKALKLLSSPKSAWEYYARGIVYESRKNDDAALADFNNAIRLQPDFTLCYVKRARILNDRKQTDAAMEALSQAIRLNPQYSGPYFTRGNIYYNQQQYEKALADFSQVTTLNPKDADAWFNRAVMNKKLGRYDVALTDYNKVAAMNPNDADIYGNRGNTYFMMDKAVEAYTDYCHAIRLNPGKAQYYVNRAAVFLRWEQTDSAFADYNHAIRLDPTYADAYIERGNIYLNIKNKPDSALADYNHVIAMNPGYSNAWLNIGVVHHNNEEFKAAIDNYSKAIEADPNNMLAYLNRADAYEATGNTRQSNLDKKKYADLGGKITASAGSSTKSIYPEGTFDAKLAAASLQRGTSRIVGRACTKKDGLIFNASGVRVLLFPVTPYLEEWYSLRDKKEGKNTRVYMSKEANKYAIEAVSGADGRFSFEGLKPGKYFIQLVHNFNQRKTARVYTGSYTAQNGPVMTTTNYYYDQDYLVERSQRLERFVEIKDDGDTRKITMANSLIKTCDF
ncbi:tetratricopeptide repeat protein [Chitinophaga sp. Cy-1792]|uniref:tetratricopeptide repeat protein n=1 Tax=Chitinophaga sp. Cy-1792 TaxID=2608339 RepID=UPI00142448C4|nr:tetratricopeptide repeat protein [Chitinophaga sp. Cy-1792]NIG55120.1 tetratricopeptide repeat protein [Chitinophaga sp. Cy-1792]